MNWDRTLAEEEFPERCNHAKEYRHGHLRKIGQEYAQVETKYSDADPERDEC